MSGFADSDTSRLRTGTRSAQVSRPLARVANGVLRGDLAEALCTTRPCLVQVTMSSEQDLRRLREEAAMDVQDSSPAILQVGEAGPAEAVREGAGGTAAGAHDWQIIDDHCLSQCGSSPRSLSHEDLDTSNFGHAVAAEESPLEESPLENVPVIEPAAVASDAESEMAQEQAAEGDNEPLVEPAVGIQDPAVEAEMPALEEEEMMQSEDKAQESQTDSDSESSFSEDAPSEQPEAPETASTGALLSGQSSYANVTMPPSTPADLSGTNTPRSAAPAVWPSDQDDAEEPGQAERLGAEEAGADEASLDEVDQDLDSDYSSEQEAVPDAGVCSVVTGYPVGSPFQQHPPVQAPGSGSFDFARLASESVPLPPSSLSLGRHSSSLLSAASGRESPRPVAPELSHWAQWTKKAGSTRAGKLLKSLWSTLQVYASRAGAAIPPKLKARIQGLLQFVDGSVPGGSKAWTRLLVSGLVAVSVMLAWTCARNRTLVRALRAREDELQHHILTILDLNAKMTNSVDIPITRHCGYKSSLTLSHSIF